MPQNLSRRRFLQLTAAGSAALLGGSWITLSPQQALASRARQEAGILRVAWNTPADLDPLISSADSEVSFLNAVYDYLIDTDANSQLLPRLAASWEVSEDGLRYTLQIREGVVFHDGSPLTLEDIIWTFDRLRGEGATKDLFANITAITAGEGNTLVFELASLNPDFLYTLSDNHAVILKTGATDFNTVFNGTGPFIVEEYTPGSRAFLATNGAYWAQPAALSGLEFIYFDDPQAVVSALQGGEVDVVFRTDTATFFNLASDGALAAIDIPTSGHEVVRLRADRAPGNDERVQKAFKLATDRQAIWERLQLGYGAPGKDSPIGPIFAAYYNTDIEAPARDPEAAKALLAEAGYPDGLDITLYLPNGGNRPDLAQALAAQWAEAGIRAEIEIQDEATYYADSGWLEVDLGITPWGSRPVPQIYLDLYVKTGAIWNEAHYSNARVDELITLAGSTVDEEARTAAYKEIQAIMLESGPIIIPYFFAQFMVHAAEVTGLSLHPFAGRTSLNGVTVLPVVAAAGTVAPVATSGIVAVSTPLAVSPEEQNTGPESSSEDDGNSVLLPLGVGAVIALIGGALAFMNSRRNKPDGSQNT
jgi:peptide/nickel transport system substrate-binding protein